MAGDRKHFLEGKSIVVAGGGIAGSAFAVAIRRLWDPSLHPPTIVILERDSEDVSRQREGYSLSLAGHDNTGGLAALKKLGLLDDIVGRAVSGAGEKGAFKIWGPDWKEKISLKRKPMAGLPASSVRVARRELRQVLHDAALSSDTCSIQWETRCISATQLENGRVRVTAQKGPDGRPHQEDCDLLVVADGASSKLRAVLRPDDKLQYAGAVLRGGLARFDRPMPKSLDADWGFQLSGDGVSCFYSPVDKDSVVWAVGHMEPDQVTGFDPRSEKSALQVIAHAQQLGARFHEPFNTIVDHTDPTTVMCINARDKMPFAHGDQLEKMPAVFIGDSNHALSPFAGFGANLALNDGWDLAEQLCSRGATSLAAAVGGYDAVSVPRAARVVKASRQRLRVGHSTGFRLWLFCFMLALGKFVGLMLGR